MNPLSQKKTLELLKDEEFWDDARYSDDWNKGYHSCIQHLKAKIEAGALDTDKPKGGCSDCKHMYKPYSTEYCGRTGSSTIRLLQDQPELCYWEPKPETRGIIRWVGDLLW